MRGTAALARLEPAQQRCAGQCQRVMPIGNGHLADVPTYP